MPVSDAYYLLRDGSAVLNLAASVETSVGVHVGEGPIQGMKLRIHCPLGNGTVPTLDIVLQQCETLAGVYAAVPGGTVPQITDVINSYHEHYVKWTMPFLRYTATLTGANADFGLVTIGLTPGQITVS